MKSFSWIMVLLLGCLSGYAQQHTDSAVMLQEVKIFAAKTDARSSKLPYLFSRMSRKELSAQPCRTIAEALSAVPGILVQKSNYGGGSPFVRGLTGNQNLVLVDGIRLNNSIFRYGPNQYLTLVEPALIEQVEVLKGSGSVQFGSDAISGVIYLSTKELSFQPKEKWRGTLTGRYTDRNMEFSWRPELIYEGKRFALMIGGGRKQFGDVHAGAGIGLQSPSGYTEDSYDLKTKWNAGHDWTFTAAYQFLQQNELPAYYKYQYENYALNHSDPIRRTLGYIQAKKQYAQGPIAALSLFTSVQTISEKRNLQKNGSATLRREQEAVQTVAAGAEMEMTFTKHWKSSNGIECYHDDIRSNRTDLNTGTNTETELRGLYPDRSAYDNLSVYSLQHLQFGKWNIEAGARYNVYRALIRDTVLGDISIRPAAWVSQLGLNYQLFEKVGFFGHVSEGFRAPNLDDLGTLGIVDFRYELPEYKLKPERSLNTEAGARYVSAKLELNVSFFYNHLKNLIARVKRGDKIMGYDVYIKQNVDQGYIKGYESNLRWHPLQGMEVEASLTSITGYSITRNEPLRRIPPLMAGVNIQYRKGAFRYGLRFDHADPQRKLSQGDKEDIRIGITGTEGYNVLHAFGNYTSRHFATKLYLNNLFDQRYKTHGSGLYEMGRSFTVATSFFF